MANVAEIMDGMMNLSRADRSYLAQKLIESLDQEAEFGPEWMEEIERRVARRESGESKAIASEDVHADIESIISK